METGAGFVPVCIRGRYLWKGDSRFLVRGIVYQIPRTHTPGISASVDAISDDRLPQVKRDIQLFRELGINTLFVYHIDCAKIHDKTMTMLSEAGIYVLFTVKASGINRSKAEESYNFMTMTSFFATVDLMACHLNTLGLFVASGLINDVASIAVTPFLRAAVRDIKMYMKLRSEITGQRVLPVGYAAASQDRSSLTDLSVGDTSSSIDFWACVNFAWAGTSSMAESGWDALIDRLTTATIPIVLSEYGSNAYQPRLFQETKALYSPQMTHVFSGGCVYEFWQAGNRYGLVEMLQREGNPRSEAYQQALTRADDQNKVLEKRETDEGTLLIYHDFANYKASLEATRDVEAKWDCDQELAVAEGQGDHSNQTSRLQLAQLNVPDTCVYWDQVEESIRRSHA